MKQHILFTFLSLMFFQSCMGQEPQEENTGLRFYINFNVENEEEEDEARIIQRWKDYLNSREMYSTGNSFWKSEKRIPDATLFGLMFHTMNERSPVLQNNIIGIFPVEENYYALKMMFSQVKDSSQQVVLNDMLTVYAKEIDGEFYFSSSTDYYRLIWEKQVVGDITYYIHPAHQFNKEDAIKMNEFNVEIARKFEVEPLEFDYFVSTYSREISDLMGFDFMKYKYQKVQSGGMAATFDNVIYAGNNSAYYPHEVVHLYTYLKYARQYHAWADEGIATLFGGSTGYSLEWHLGELKEFLNNNEDYLLDDLKALEISIPNGTYKTDFRYAIGGLIAKNIYDKEGMKGLFDLLQTGQSEEEYFEMLKQKLGFERVNFGAYVRKEVQAF